MQQIGSVILYLSKNTEYSPLNRPILFLKIGTDRAYITGMKIAVTTWNDRIAPVYDASKTVTVYVIENRMVTAGDCFAFPSATNRAAFLASCGIDILLCGAISTASCEELKRRNIEVHSFLAGSTADIIIGLREGRLSERCFLMPGCRCRRRRCRKGSEYTVATSTDADK